MREITIHASTTTTMALPTSNSISDRLNILLPRAAVTVMVCTTFLPVPRSTASPKGYVHTAVASGEAAGGQSATAVKGMSCYVCSNGAAPAQ